MERPPLQDEAAKISAELDQWRSPRLGSLPLGESSYRYEGDAAAWLQGDVDADNAAANAQEAEDDDAMEEELTMTAETNPVQPPDRVGTPVMSNASKRSDHMDEDEEYPVNVQSPWIATMETPTTPGGVPSPAVVELSQQTPSVLRSTISAKSSHSDYRRYYEAFLVYLRGKRRLRERMDLEQQHQALLSDTGGDAMEIVPNEEGTIPWSTSTDLTRKLISDEQFLEVDYLRSLSVLCWDRITMDRAMNDPARKEGNFWELVCRLREHGLASLIWHDDTMSKNQNDSSVQAFVQDLARQIESTPQELMYLLRNSPGCPLILRRRRQILQWLERCFQKVLPDRVTRARQTTIRVNEKLFTQGLPETDKDPQILQCALALILAGRLSDAQQLARDSGIPWRAAVWGGGAPHGYDEEGNEVGNPRRFLWKRMMWHQTEKLCTEPAALDEETAIAALLSSHLKAALDNASLPSWEHGLLATIRAMLERTEDEILQKHNDNRRRVQPPFPGTENELAERELLQLTSYLSGVNESEAIQILKATPSEAMKYTDPVTNATASFLVGKSAILSYLVKEAAAADEKVASEQDASVLRFLTHLALYLDSLAKCTTPVLLENVSDCKDQLLCRYVEFLASREDLWYMMVVYASLLPEYYLLETLPKYLSPFSSSPSERKVLVQQLQEFLPTVGLDLQILQRVVQSVLNETLPGQSTDKPTRLDWRKIKAIYWLVDAKYAGAALVATNQLLRQFLLAGKFQSARVLRDITSGDDELREMLRDSPEEEQASDKELDHAKREFGAWQAYLYALESYDEWRQTVEQTASSSTNNNKTTEAQLDHSRLLPGEATIAARMERRVVIQDKREAMSQVVKSADKAQSALKSVLQCPGGWLWIEEDDAVPLKTRQELEELRTQLLAKVVCFYQEVCLLTSEWLSNALDDAAVQLDEDRHAALTLLDETCDATTTCSPMAPVYWARQAVNIVQTVVSDTYKIGSVFGTSELKNLLDRTKMSAVAELLQGE